VGYCGRNTLIIGEVSSGDWRGIFRRLEKYLQEIGEVSSGDWRGIFRRLERYLQEIGEVSSGERL